MLSSRIGSLRTRGLHKAAQFCGVKQTSSKVVNFTCGNVVGRSSASIGFRAFSSVKDPSSAPVTEKKGGFFEKYFGLDSNVAPESFKSRWLMILPAFLTHMSIGAPYAWSLMAEVVSKENGFVASAASDWNLMQSALPLSIVFAAFGVSSFFLGKYQIAFGARKSMALSALTFGGGLAIGAAAIHIHSLPLLYLGYGVLGGIGIGWGYTPPVQALLQWFPDKKGLASGLTIAGFGSGALLFTPASQYLMKKFAVLPEYLGPASDFITKTIDSKLFVEIGGVLKEVVSAGPAELAKLSFPGLQEGLYVVGTGSTGAAEALAVMSAVYATTVFASSLFMFKPHPTVAATLPQPASTGAGPAVVVPDMLPDDALRTPQFKLLGLSFYCIATGGLGLFSVAKPMMSEVFSSLLPTVVTSAFAAKYLLGMSAGNLGGRLGWATISDKLGRRNIFTLFTLGSIPLYAGLPTLVDNVASVGSTVPLYAFCASTIAAISIMGGTYAVLPAYEADMYGSKFIGSIHGKMMLFSAAGSLSGPNLLFYLRSSSEKAAINDLLANITPEKFESVFGAPLSQAADLMASKTLTISKLMVHMPPGVLDPTPHIYDSTMYALSGLMAVAFVSHSMVRPMNHALSATVTDVKNIPDAPVPTPAVAATREEKVGDRQLNK